jgi:hypothetical protein
MKVSEALELLLRGEVRSVKLPDDCRGVITLHDLDRPAKVLHFESDFERN